MSAVDRVLEHVEGVQKKGNGFWALCPAHDDHNPSLHIQEGDDGRALVICRAGCEQACVMDALKTRGLKPGDLFPDEEGTRSRSKATRSASKGRERLVKELRHPRRCRDLAGHPRALGRSPTPDEKSFKWKLPNGKYSRGDIIPAAMPLYNSELIASWPEGCRIVLVEGETPAEALRVRGIRAVGTVCGASSTPERDVLEVLSGHEVIAWPDNDAGGLAHMRRCARLLEGIARAVRWFEWKEAPRKGDAADHPAIEGGDREALKALALALRDAPEVPDEPHQARGGRGTAELPAARRF